MVKIVLSSSPREGSIQCQRGRPGEDYTEKKLNQQEDTRLTLENALSYASEAL